MSNVITNHKQAAALLYLSLRDLFEGRICAADPAVKQTLLAVRHFDCELPVNRHTEEQEKFVTAIRERLFPSRHIEDVRDFFDSLPVELSQQYDLPDVAWDVLYGWEEDFLGSLIVGFYKTKAGDWYVKNRFADWWYGPLIDSFDPKDPDYQASADALPTGTAYMKKTSCQRYYETVKND